MNEQFTHTAHRSGAQPVRGTGGMCTPPPPPFPQKSFDLRSACVCSDPRDHCPVLAVKPVHAPLEGESTTALQITNTICAHDKTHDPLVYWRHPGSHQLHYTRARQRTWCGCCCRSLPPSLCEPSVSIPVYVTVWPFSSWPSNTELHTGFRSYHWR